MRTLLAAGAVAVTAMVAWQFIDVRSQRDYLTGRSKSLLTVDLGDVSPKLRGIHTSPAIAEYLSAERDCIAGHPAGRVAVVPGDVSPGAVFGAHPALPIDWLWPPEYAPKGDRDRIISAAQRLGREGNYLVLFQTDSVGLYSAAHITPATSTQLPGFPYDGPLGTAIGQALHGQRFDCGPFVGIYEPRKL